MASYLNRALLAALVSTTAMFASAPAASAARCVGTLVGAFDNIVVPEGRSCSLYNSVVTGNVRVEENALLDAQNDVVGLNVTGVDGSVLGLSENVDVGGSVLGVGADVVQIINSTVGGRVTIRDDDVNNRDMADVVVTDSSVAGSLTIAERENEDLIVVADNGPTDSHPDNPGLGGPVRVIDNRTRDILWVIRNKIGQDATVSRNTGPAQKEVSLNEVIGALSCFNNAQPFIAGSNVAADTRGQCRQ